MALRFELNNILNAVIRFFQFIFGIVVIGLYAQDLNKAHKERKYSDGKWVYAVVVSTLSTITALAFAILSMLVTFSSVALFFAWEWILFILWIAVVGIFGSMYFKENPEGDSGVSRMKHASYIDCVNLVLWFITACWTTFYFFFRREGGGGGGGGGGVKNLLSRGGGSKSSYTGRARMRD